MYIYIYIHITSSTVFRQPLRGRVSGGSFLATAAIGTRPGRDRGRGRHMEILKEEFEEVGDLGNEGLRE